MEILENYIQESNLTFSIKNLPTFIKYAFKSQGDLESVKKRLNEIINRCSSIQEIKMMRSDLSAGINYFNKVIIPSYDLINKDKSKLSSKEKGMLKVLQPYLKYGTTKNDVKKYVDWLKTDAKKILNDKAKEIRNK